MSSIELVDYYDEAGRLIGTCPRKEAEAKNYTTPNAVIFLFNQDGQVLLQKRSQTKNHYPGLWDPTACGGLNPGENAGEAAERELFEEMGIKCDLTLVEKFLNVFPSEDRSHSRTRLTSLYVGISGEDPAHNHEVESTAWFNRTELLTQVRLAPENYVPCFEIEYEKALVGYARFGDLPTR